jgi:Holliday junction resolvase RusA-like endonuclease
LRKIDIKPLSVNKCWQGKRFKTKDYVSYEKKCILLLPKIKVGVPPYLLNIVFGFSSPLADIDNGLKPFIDILQKRYGFNDKDIIELNVKKEKTVKGKEFILFEILTINK